MGIRMQRGSLGTVLKHALALFAFLAMTSPAPAQPTLSRSAGQPDVHVLAAETKALIASLNELMDKQQAALEAATRDASARAKWSEKDRAKFFQTILRAKPHTDIDRQIGLLTGELRGMLQILQRSEINGRDAEYRFIARVRELVGQLRSCYERQSAYVTQQLRNVHLAKKP